MITSSWRIVKVFVSSTFRDMGAERDALAKIVFPALREQLERYRIQVIDIDLRWGIPRTEVATRGALSSCFDVIAECQPFFICLLGEVYGSVIADHDAYLVHRHPWLADCPGCSITELEVRYFNHLVSAAHQPRSLFYFRDSTVLNGIPVAIRQARYMETDPVRRQKHQGLKKRIRESGSALFDGYPATWNPTATDPFSLQKGSIGGLDELLRRVQEDLYRAILEHMGPIDLDPTREPAEIDEFARATASHDLYGEVARQNFIGRESALKQISDYLAEPKGHPLVVSGETGQGKTAIMGAAYDLCRKKWPNSISVAHFVGATGESFSLANALARFDRAIHEPEPGHNATPLGTAEQMAAFASHLRHLPPDRDVILLVDGLDEMDQADRACGLEWIPNSLPPGVRLICSARVVPPLPSKDSGGIEILVDMRTPILLSTDAGGTAARLGHPCVVMPRLSHPEIDKLIERMSAMYAKTLEPHDKQQLSALAYRDNPLFLTVVLEELRLFGSFDNLEQFIATLPNPAEVPRQFHDFALSTVFIHLLTRLYAELDAEVLGRMLGFLSITRSGLGEPELCQLTGVGPSDGQVAYILRRMRPYLHMRENRYSVRYEPLRHAIHFLLDENFADDELLDGLGHLAKHSRERSLGISIRARPLGGGLRRDEQRHSALARLFENLPLDHRKATDLYYHLSLGTAADKDCLLEQLYTDPALLHLAWTLDRDSVEKYARSALCGAQWVETNKLMELDTVVNGVVHRLEDEAHENYQKQDFDQVVRLCRQEEVVGLVSHKNDATETARSNMMLVFVEQQRWAPCAEILAAHKADCVSRNAPENMVKLLVTVMLRCIVRKHLAEAATYMLELAPISEVPAVQRRLQSLDRSEKLVQVATLQLNGLGTYLLTQERRADAVTCFRLQVSIYLLFKDMVNAAISTANVGIAYYNTQALSEAVPESIRSVHLWFQLKDLTRMRQPLELAITAANRIGHPALQHLLDLYEEFWDDTPTMDWERAGNYIERAVALIEMKQSSQPPPPPANKSGKDNHEKKEVEIGPDDQRERLARKLTVLNQYGLYDRPAYLIVKTLAPFQGITSVEFTANDETVNGFSIMGIMMLAAVQCTEMVVLADGFHARKAIERITSLFNEGFRTGEPCLPIPPAHSEWVEPK